jgi:hypothetical protein
MPCVTAIADNGRPEATMKGVCCPDYIWQRNTRTGVDNTGYGNNQVQDDGRRTKATSIVFILGRAQTNKLGQGSKEVGIYVPADVDNKNNITPYMAMTTPVTVIRPRPMAVHSQGLNRQSGWHIRAGQRQW